MQEALFQYFLQSGKLPLSGIGTFYQEHLPARLDFAGKQLHAPAQVVRFALENSTVENRLYDFLGRRFREEQADAIRRYNDFCYQLKQTLNQDGQASLRGIGRLQKAFANTYSFQPAADPTQWMPPVTLERVVRQSSEEVASEILAAQPVTEVAMEGEGRQWMVWAAVVAVVSIVLIVLYWYYQPSV